MHGNVAKSVSVFLLQYKCGRLSINYVEYVKIILDRMLDGVFIYDIHSYVVFVNARISNIKPKAMTETL